MNPRRRLALLAACLLAGAGVGGIGQAWSGDPTWFMAIPAAVAVGWWWVADPTHCDVRQRDRDGAEPEEPRR